MTRNKSVLFFLIFFSFLFSSCKIDEKEKVYITDFEYSLIGMGGTYHPFSSEYQLQKLADLLPNRKGYLWLKGEFIIPENLEKQKLGIYLGITKIAVGLYINGNFIAQSGSFPPIVFSQGEVPTYFSIPPECLNEPGKANIIELKFWVDSQGQLDKTPFISTFENVYNYYQKIDFKDSKLSLIVSYIMFVVAFIYFVLYIFKSNEKSNLSFSRLNFLSAFYMLTVCIGEYPRELLNYQHAYLLYLKIFSGVVSVITSYFAVSFIRDYLGAKDSKGRKIYRICITILPCIAILVTQNIKQFYIVLGYVYILIAIHIFYAVKIIFIAFKQKNNKIWSLLTGFSPVLISLLIEINWMLLGNSFSKLIIVLGWQVTILTFVAIMIINFARMGNKIEYLNDNLERLVKDRTNELQNTNKLLEETNSHLEYERKRAQKEIDLAAFVQQSFYKNSLPDLQDWDIGFYFEALSGVSGDLYDFFTEDGKLDGFGIFDVSGHGIASGLVTMLVKNIIHQEFYSGNELPINSVMEIINNRIIEEKGNIKNYLTGILARVISSSKIEFINAGHPFPLLYVNSLNKTITLEPEDQKKCGVIGIADLPAFFETQNIELNSGDALLLYTDGIIEAHNDFRDEYGLKRLEEIFNKTQKMPIPKQIDKILKDIKKFIHNENIGDDVTLLIIRKK